MTMPLNQEKLAVLARDAKCGLERTKAGRAEWIKGTFELARALREARELLGANDAFGLWVKDAGLELSKDDRAALINLAVHEKRARKVLDEHPDCWSWRGAWNEIRWQRQERRMASSQPANTTQDVSPGKASSQPAKTADNVAAGEAGAYRAAS